MWTRIWKRQYLTRGIMIAFLAFGISNTPMTGIADAATSNGPTDHTVEETLDDLEILDHVIVESFTANPAIVRPFDPSTAMLRWRARVPNVQSAGSIKFAITDGFVMHDSPVPAQGTLSVQPNQDTTYHLKASLGRATRDLGAVTVRMDTSACQTVRIIESIVHAQVEDTVHNAIPAEYRHKIYEARTIVDVVPAGIRIHFTSQYALDNWFDPDLTIDILMALTAEKGRLKITYEQFDVDVDADFLADAFLFLYDPNFIRSIEAEISMRLLTVLNDQFLALGHAPADSRLWSVRTAVPGNSGSDEVVVVACPYPRPWSVTVTFFNVRVLDPVDPDRLAAIRFFFGVNGWRRTHPAGAPLDLPLNSRGESVTVNLPTELRVELNAGVLDTLHVAARAEDDNKESTICTPDHKPPCPPLPLPTVVRTSDWTNNFSRGVHTARSSDLAGESFEITYRIDVSPNCQGSVCITLPSSLQK